MKNDKPLLLVEYISLFSQMSGLESVLREAAFGESTIPNVNSPTFRVWMEESHRQQREVLKLMAEATLLVSEDCGDGGTEKRLEKMWADFVEAGKFVRS